jgi:hypothetical protein
MQNYLGGVFTAHTFNYKRTNRETPTHKRTLNHYTPILQIFFALVGVSLMLPIPPLRHRRAAFVGMQRW